MWKIAFCDTSGTLWRFYSSCKCHQKSICMHLANTIVLYNSKTIFVTNYEGYIAYLYSAISKTRAVPSVDTETRKSLLAETERDWMGSLCPLKVLTQSPERLSHNRTFPSAQPVARYLDPPSQVKHVTPSCHTRKISSIRTVEENKNVKYVKYDTQQLTLDGSKQADDFFFLIIERVGRTWWW